MSDMAHIAVLRNWERHQHYKDRDPPWIKLYRDVLTCESWVFGTDESRLVQLASTLLAARYHNATPINFELWKKVASLDMTRAKFEAAIEHLARHNFLEIQAVNDERKQDASNSLAKCSSEQSRAEQRESRADSARKRATPRRRCPEDFDPGDAERTKIRAECPDVDPLAEERKFRDHEFAKAKSDWLATWRNWMREAQSRAKRSNGAGRPTRYEELMARVSAAKPAPAEATPELRFMTGRKP